MSDEDRINVLEAELEERDKRINELEKRLEVLEDRVDDNRFQLEKKLADTNSRVTALEKGTTRGELEVMSGLSDMEQYLTKKKNMPPQRESTKRRAIALGKIFMDHAEKAKGRGDTGRSLKTRGNNIGALIAQELVEEKNNLSAKQVHRSMEKFVELFEGREVKLKKKKGGWILRVENVKNIYWDKASLEKAIGESA